MTTTTKAIKTTIHAYKFDVSKPADAKAYAELCAKMQAQGTKCFESWGGKESHYQPRLDGRLLTLETSYVFDNQWNTGPVEGVSDTGLRVFDWAQDYMPTGYNKKIKKGHYLDMTTEMVEVRQNRLKCGYCGKQYDKRDQPTPPEFCPACRGSQYLKPEDLKLTRIEPVVRPDRQKFAPLTAEESAWLMPLYQAEQAGKGSERAVKAREELGRKIQKKYKEKVEEASAEYTGMQWLFEHGCSLRLMENCIYYSHTQVFTFGWREKLKVGADLDWLMENLSEFPGEYNIVTEHRGVIGGRE